MRVGSLLLWALLLVACDGSTEPPPVDAGVDAGPGRPPCPRDGGRFDGGEARGLTNVCTEGLVLSGLGLRWDDGSHRVARWGVFPRIGAEHFPAGCLPWSELRGASLVALLEGGPETRGPSAPGGEVLATYHVIGAGNTTPPPDTGGLRIARGAVTVDLEAEAEESALVLFNLATAGMIDAAAVVVVLDGLELTTDVPQASGYPTDYDPRDGYSVRGIGAAIENVRREETTLRFDARARFALGRRDRPAMNRAVGGARTRAVVYYAVIALPREPERGQVTYRAQHQAHGEAELSVCRPDPALTRLTLTGQPGLSAAPALSAFRLDLFTDTDDEGDDVRELSVRIVDFDHDPSTGEASLRVEGHASNEGPPPPARAMDYTVTADVALLQWQGSAAEELVVSAPITPGRDEIMLPLTRR